MNADEPFAKLDAAPDRTIPEDCEPRTESIEEIDAEIAAWTARMETIAAIKAKTRPVEQTGLALDDLHRLRALGMEAAERNERQAQGVLTVREQDEAVRGDCGLRFTRIAKAVRQIVVLEQEMMGLRDVPVPKGSAARPSADAAPDQRSPASTSAASGGAGEGKEGEGKERERSDLHDPDDTVSVRPEP
jgi:hypothetical protein